MVKTAFFRKIVGALPGSLLPNCFYAVRTGAGFDLHLSDSTGTVAHPLNAAKIVTFTDRAAYDAYVAPDNVIAIYTGA